MKRYLREKFSRISDRFNTDKEARVLQAKEYKRRLKQLNGEAKRLREMKSELIPREVFDRTISDLRKDIMLLQKIVWSALGAIFLLEFIFKYIK